MTHSQQRIFWAVAIALSVLCIDLKADRTRDTFDFDWKFALAAPDGAEAVDFDDSAWSDTQLPHDWSMSLPYIVPDGRKETYRFGSMGFMQGGIGWYRKSFDVPKAWKGKKVYIEFDGVYHRSTVYVNGQKVGFHPYGYTAFEYDITDLLHQGADNVIAVKVDHSDCPTSRWYSGSGIYRHVWLTAKDPIHISNWGTFVTTPSASKEAAEVNVVTEVENTSAKPSNFTLTSEIVDRAGISVYKTSSAVSLAAGEKTSIAQKASVLSPSLWDIDSPALYTMVSTIHKGPKVLDSSRTPFGIREIRFDPAKGFFLNGRSVKMKGGDVHQDAGSLGAAIPDRALERRVQIMKEMGFNAIRCSHNPPAREFLDCCDRLGMLVIDESFDKWKSGYYSDYYDEWWRKDLSSMILRDRNHPSVVLWSVGNETVEQKDKSGEGTARLAALRKAVESLDTTRKVSVTIMPDYARTFDLNGFCEATEVVGYNYREPFFDEDHKAHPDRILYGSEVFPYYYPGYKAMRQYIEKNPWYDYAERDYLFGYFMWAAIDYWGESSGWPSKAWPTGIFDVCMFEKPSAAFFRAVWNPDTPIVKIAVADNSLKIDPGKDMWSWPFIASHWTFPQYEGYMLEVQTITNCEEVELLVDGVSLGRRATADFSNNTIVWRTPYKPGKITAKGYDGGKEVTADELRTAGEPASIELTADRSEILSDGQDLSHISIRLLDSYGTLVPDDDRKVTVSVEGAGRFLAMDNGDTMDSGAQLRNDKPTYFGRALAIVQSLREPGVITVTASVEGLPSATVSVTAK